MIIWSIPRENLHWRKQNKAKQKCTYTQNLNLLQQQISNILNSHFLLANKEKKPLTISVSKHQFKAKHIICLSKCRVIWKRAYTLTETFAVTAAAKPEFISECYQCSVCFYLWFMCNLKKLNRPTHVRSEVTGNKLMITIILIEKQQWTMWLWRYKNNYKIITVFHEVKEEEDE